MKIKPLSNKIYIKQDKPTAGSLDLSSKPTAIEYGEVIAVGDSVTHLKPGDKIFVKAWALDIITYDKEVYYFCDADSLGICAIVE